MVGILDSQTSDIPSAQPYETDEPTHIENELQRGEAQVLGHTPADQADLKQDMESPPAVEHVRANQAHQTDGQDAEVFEHSRAIEENLPKGDAPPEAEQAEAGKQPEAEGEKEDDAASSSSESSTSSKSSKPVSEGFVEEPARRKQSVTSKAKAKAQAAKEKADAAKDAAKQKQGAAKEKTARAQAKAKAQSQLLKDAVADNKALSANYEELNSKFKSWKRNHKDHNLTAAFDKAGGFKQDKSKLKMYLDMFKTTVMTKGAKDNDTPKHNAQKHPCDQNRIV